LLADLGVSATGGAASADGRLVALIRASALMSDYLTVTSGVPKLALSIPKREGNVETETL